MFSIAQLSPIPVPLHHLVVVLQTLRVVEDYLSVIFEVEEGFLLVDAYGLPVSSSVVWTLAKTGQPVASLTPSSPCGCGRSGRSGGRVRGLLGEDATGFDAPFPKLVYARLLGTLRRLMCNWGPRRRSQNLCWDLAFSQRRCRIMDLDSFLVSLYVLVDDWWEASHYSSNPPRPTSPARRLGGPHARDPRPLVAPLPQ